jgi:folliculin
MFSIIVVMMDKIFILNSWPFLVKHIQLIIDELKQKSNAKFDVETEARQPSRLCRPMKSSLTYSTLPRSASYRLQRGCGNKPTRSLTELTGDKEVFERLHTAFSWLLKAGGDRLTERLLEGPSTEGCCLVDTTRLEGR